MIVSNTVMAASDACGQLPTEQRTERQSLQRSTSRPLIGRQSTSTKRSSLVHQKLQTAIQSGERAAAEYTQQSSFRARGIASAAEAEKGESDRSVSRYRNDAAIVSFADPPSSSTASSTSGFCYSSNFMPGVHFYTFLAMKEGSSATGVSAARHVPPSPGRSKPAVSFTENADSCHHEMITRTPPGLRMWIPDTVVYGETGRAVLLYTDEDGFVQRSTEVTDKIVVERLVVSSGSDLDPIVVCKEPMTAPAKKTDGNALSYQGNLLRLLSPGELKTVLSNVSSTRNSKSFALQKFVRCNGSKAFIVRAIHEAGKPAYAWMINNTTPIVSPTPTVSQVLLSLGHDATQNTFVGQGLTRSGSLVGQPSNLVTSSGQAESAQAATADQNDQLASGSVNVPLVNRVCTSVQLDKSCTFIKLGERGCTKVADLNQRLVRYIERRLRLPIQTLVADFTKDGEGRWWLLQVKHFRIKTTSNPSKSYFSLPRRLRVQYLGYRDMSIVEETADSDEDHEKERRAAHVAAQMAQRQVRKLIQCKCCLAAYPKGELSFKMTLKMINEMLVRIRSRLPPEKSYTFLTAALAREATDPSLAYESWSVCSYCYAIYERDQQLQKVEMKFADILGAPDINTVRAGLGKLDERAAVIDPSATSTVLPSQLTLCRLMLVINGIYDIPPELYDAEQDSTEVVTMQTDERSKTQGGTTLHAVASRLYLRISALGYTECIPVNPADICISHEQAPRGTRRRRSSATSPADDSDSGDSDDGGGRSAARRHARGRNYWLPVHLIRTVHFFAPRTPLHAKLKETSGLTPFLNEDNSISIQFIRATAPPLQDPMPVTAMSAERNRARRTALQPQPHDAFVPLKADVPKKPYNFSVVNHSILLGATKLRMAQFRSAYVTKLDFYACMALTGEMFNIKGNIGLERVRYVETKLVTARYRLRAFNGVYIPDASYVPSDPLTSEWMDCLRATAITGTPSMNIVQGGGAMHEATELTERKESAGGVRPGGLTRGARTGHSSSTTSLSAGNEDMDEELEHMIERNCQQQQTLEDSTRIGGRQRVRSETKISDNGGHAEEEATKFKQSIDVLSTTKPVRDAAGHSRLHVIKQTLVPTVQSPSKIDEQMATLMHKPILSPRCKANAQEHVISPPSNPTCQKARLWSLNLQLNHAHNLQSRERPFCRWECYYELFGQRRSAVERVSSICPTSPHAAAPEPPPADSTNETYLKGNDVSFNCTHRFFLSSTSPQMSSHIKAHPVIVMHLRNDIYASTRSQATGEFFCKLDVSDLMKTKRLNTTLDIHVSPDAPELTPREAAVVSRSPPYLSVSIHLSDLSMNPDEVVANGDFVVVGSTNDHILVLKKIT